MRFVTQFIKSDDGYVRRTAKKSNASNFPLLLMDILLYPLRMCGIAFPGASATRSTRVWPSERKLLFWRNVVQTFHADLAIIGAGGAGLRTAIAAAQANPNAKIALISNV